MKFVADINVLDGNNNVVKISDTKMKIRIALPEDLNGYDKYEVVYIVNDEIKETIPATVENGYIVFETSHLSQYGIIATNTGKEKNNDINNETNNETKKLKTDDNSNQYGIVGTNTGNETTSPKTGDNRNMFLWVALLFVSGGVFITATAVDRKKK